MRKQRHDRGKGAAAVLCTAGLCEVNEAAAARGEGGGGRKQTSSSSENDVPDDDHGDLLESERVQCVIAPLWTNIGNKEKYN